MSRSRHATTLFVDTSTLASVDPDSHAKADPVPTREAFIDQLAARMQRSRAKGTTLDYSFPKSGEPNVSATSSTAPFASHPPQFRPSQPHLAEPRRQLSPFCPDVSASTPFSCAQSPLKQSQARPFASVPAATNLNGTAARSTLQRPHGFGSTFFRLIDIENTRLILERTKRLLARVRSRRTSIGPLDNMKQYSIEPMEPSLSHIISTAPATPHNSQSQEKEPEFHR